MSVLPLVPQAGLQNPTTHHTYSHQTSFVDLSKCLAICLSLLLLGCICYCSCFGWINCLVVICCCHCLFLLFGCKITISFLCLPVGAGRSSWDGGGEREGMIASGNFVPQLQVQIYPLFYYMFHLDYYGVSIHNTHYLAMIKLTATHS